MNKPEIIDPDGLPIVDTESIFQACKSDLYRQAASGRALLNIRSSMGMPEHAAVALIAGCITSGIRSRTAIIGKVSRTLPCSKAFAAHILKELRGEYPDRSLWYRTGEGYALHQTPSRFSVSPSLIAADKAPPSLFGSSLDAHEHFPLWR